MAQPWEQSLDDPLEADAHWYDTSDGESSDGECTPDEAAQLMIDLVIHMAYTGQISARSACVIFWWAGKAGLAAVRRWSFRPDAPSGHYQRHLDTMLGSKLNRKDRYHVSIPAYQKHERGRTIRQTPVQMPYEVLDVEANTDPYFLDTLTNAIDNDELPPLYKTCAGDGRIASPVALYTDGVQFFKNAIRCLASGCTMFCRVRDTCALPLGRVGCVVAGAAAGAPFGRLWIFYGGLSSTRVSASTPAPGTATHLSQASAPQKPAHLWRRGLCLLT